MEEANASPTDSKHYRQRKKQLYNDILQLMEFYFSDANLTKSRFLSKLIAQDPYIDISTFLLFNKLKKLTTCVEDIKKAVKNSELIELSEDKSKIRRKTPIVQKQNVDECTIYVERLPSDAEHDWVQKLFSRFGTVDYIAIPKYKHNKMIKGFAFIEFDKPDSADKAIEYFESIGCKLPSEMTPDDLCSIKTFDEENTKKQKKETTENTSQEESKMDIKEEVGNVLKRKLSTDSDTQRKKLKEDDMKIAPDEIMNKFDENVITVGSTAIEPNLPTESSNEDEKQKKKRKRKKTNKQKQDMKEIGLQVLSKKEWKKMRNKYLDLQRSKMKKLKQHLNHIRFSKGRNNEENMQTDIQGDVKEHEKIIENKEFPSKIQYTKENMETGIQGDVKDHEKVIENKEIPSKIQYSPGVIVHTKFATPIEEIKKLKAKLKSYSPNIQFVDVQSDFLSAYVRFSDTEEAQKFCKSELEAESALIEGDDEQNYWKKINEEREKKQNKERTKQRGREKLLKRAEKELGKHIRFDNDD